MKITKSYIKQLVKEELEAVMNEGYKGRLYDTNPTLRPSHPSVVSDRQEAPKTKKPEPADQMADEISKILMNYTSLRISKSGTIAREIAEEFQQKGFEEESLKDFLVKNTFLQEDESAIAAKEIVKQLG